MNYFNHKNVQLAYEAVYNQDLCESMEDLGLIGEYDYLDEERKEDKIARQKGNPPTPAQKEAKRNKETGLSTSTREVLHNRRRNPHGRLGSYYHDLRMKLALGKYNDREGNPQFTGHYSRHPKSYDMDLKKYNRYLNRDENTPFKESYEFYDIILEYLIQEGYADTLGSAEIILENMSEEWIEDILLEKEGYGDDSKFKGDTDASSFRPGKDVPPVKKYGRLSRFAPSPLSGERSRTSSYVRRTVGDSPNQPRAVQMPQERKPRRVIPSRLDRK